jgi:formylglycine-generating enzyme required for sulfatase activity
LISVALKRALEGAGFAVTLVTEADADKMKEAIADFGDRLAREGDVGLFYFSGHGVQTGKGNYLLPLGRRFQRERDVELFGVEARAVLDQMARARNPLNIVILDACRDSPLPATERTAGSKGLARMETPSGSVIAYATAPGKTASDNSLGRNGLYTKHLIAAINTEGLALENVFRRVGAAVEKENPEQSPEEVMKLRSELPFYFHAPRAPGKPVQIATATPEPVNLTPQPSQAGRTSLDDLEREEATRKQWAQWQAQMKADFDKTAAFSGSADLQAKAWDRFLAAWAQDNPLSRQDDELRAQAQQRLAQARNQANADAAAAQRAAQQAATAQTTTAAAGQTQTFNVNGVGFKMVNIPAGSFEMGSPASEPERDSTEGPQHRVSLQAFQMGQTTVTQGLWQAVMGNNPSKFSNCGADCPVEQVSWNDAQGFIQKLNQLTGQSFRLPSEAEWEYAARAGSQTTYPWGNEIGQNNANCNGCGSRWDAKQTAPVGQFAANAFGLYDMHGNVWQWVQDIYHDNYSGAPADGSAWTSGRNQARGVNRGGSWGSSPRILRSAGRDWFTPGNRDGDIGFRLARTI